MFLDNYGELLKNKEISMLESRSKLFFLIRSLIQSNNTNSASLAAFDQYMTKICDVIVASTQK